MRPIALAITLALSASASAQADPLVKLSEAYRSRDATAAAAVYAPAATVIYRYNGVPEERHSGTAAIAASFQQLFDQIDPNDAVDLNFRVVERNASGSSGVYRLRLGRDTTLYGRFAVTFDGTGRFASDISTSATLADFEEPKGPVLIGPDAEDLDRSYYVRMTGRYRLPDGCMLIVTRSVARLFARNSCTNEWRGLNRVSGREWTAGDRVRSDKALRTYRFADGERSPSVEIADGTRPLTAVRADDYRTEDVAFQSADGTELRGTVYVPSDGAAPEKRAATVLIHGSGPQDRDGYASIIAVLADEMVANGRVVLAYDKRGSGQSAGDGDRAGFDTLADDAIAAMRALVLRSDVAKDRIGLAGSSQAGWVAARAVQRAPDVADVLLLGAAGSAMTVIEQNLYNTEVRMRCAGIATADVALALDQQRAFFAFLADPAKAPALDALTRTAQTRPALNDWLFPDSASTDRASGQWFTVLEPAFDPRAAWRAFKRPKLFLFGELDDSTPTRLAVARSRPVGAQVKVFRGAQHLGLATANLCRSELTDLNAFAPGLFAEIARFAKSPG